MKWAALALMLVDHVGAVLLSGDAAVWARIAGRLALPLFAYLIAYNVAVRGVEAGRYLPWLLAGAVVAQPVYTWVFGTAELNILWVLWAGVAVVGAWIEGDRAALVAAAAASVLVGLVAGYGVAGVLLVPVLVVWLRGPGVEAGVLAGGELLWLNVWHPGMVLGLVVLAVPWIVRGLRWRVPRGPRWIAYAFYPGHLLVLGVVRSVMDRFVV